MLSDFIPDNLNRNQVKPLLLFMILLLGASPANEGIADLRIVFPQDECVIDAKRDFGAVGDGKVDDTQALQAALDAGSGAGVKQHKIVYLPNGVYRIRKTLVINREQQGAGLGPWLYGESRDGVVIRLDDGVEDVNSVLRAHPKSEGKTSANWFMRTVRNMTIDAGDNPKTDGLRWFASNSGLLKDVRVIGNGPKGVNSSFIGENGPNMMQDVLIEGFETGVYSHWFYGQTLSRVTVRNCQSVGVDIQANAVGIESLVVRDTPLALAVRVPEKAHWWGGVVALVGGDFETERKSDQSAILAKGKLYARDVKTSGYKSAIEAENPVANLEEFSTTPVATIYPNTSTKSPRLPIKKEPREWEEDLDRWLCANDFGINHTDNKDDSEAFQKAFDAAAQRGATTVYIRGISGRQPNWYNVKKEVRIHGSVRHVIGLGFGRILGSDTGKFVVDDDSAPVVAFRHIDSLGGTPLTIENRSQKSTMYIESCSVNIVGKGQGDIFATNVPSHVHLHSAGQSCWVRSANLEGTNDAGLAQNLGGRLWVMGTKSEGRGPRFVTRDGGITEVFGGYEYATHAIDNEDRRPMFWSEDSTLFAAGIFEVSFTGKPYVVKLRDTRDDVTEELDRDRIWKEKKNWTVMSTTP